MAHQYRCESCDMPLSPDEMGPDCTECGDRKLDRDHERRDFVAVLTADDAAEYARSQAVESLSGLEGLDF